MSIATVIRDAAVFLNLSEDLLERGYRVRFRAAGTSMQPAIEDGDTITVAPVASTDVKRGDILLSTHGQRAIAHRVVDIHIAGSEIAAFLLRGDAKGACDAPVAPDQILGKVVAIERGGGRATPRSWCAKLIQGLHSRLKRALASRTQGSYIRL